VCSAAIVSGALVGPLRADEPSTAHNVSHTSAEFSVYTDSDDVTVYTPVLAADVRNPIAGWSTSGSFLVDIVSAATADIVSTASPRWQELRRAATLEVDYQPSNLGTTLSGSASSEPDYLSIGGGGSARLELYDKTLTPLIGYTYAHDTAGRKHTPFSVYSLELDRHTLTASLDAVLSRSSTLALTADALFEVGAQEKPYRYLALFAPGTAELIPVGASAELVNELRLPGRIVEAVPDDRERYALSVRFAHRFRHMTATLNERLYADSWGLRATTSDARHAFDIGSRLFVWPHVRFHLQSGVDFWQRAYEGDISGSQIRAPLYRTGDRELSPLLSTTVGGGARWNFGAYPSVESWSLLGALDAIYTHYFDALFIEQRWAAFAAIRLEKTF
jgi:hypothetical protein